MGTATVKHPVSNRVKPSFVIFDIRTLSSLSVRVPACQKITNGCLTRSGTGYFTQQMYPYGNSGRQSVKCVERRCWCDRDCQAVPHLSCGDMESSFTDDGKTSRRNAKTVRTGWYGCWSQSP